MAKIHMPVILIASTMAACVPLDPGGDSSTTCPRVDAPAPSQSLIDASSCPPAEVYLSVLFDGSNNPVGIGGGTDVSTSEKNDKKVNAGDKICWIGIVDADTTANVKFDILFSPADGPNPNQKWHHIPIHPQAPSGVQYKYTVWTEFSTSSEDCTYFDPRIVIN